MADTGYDPKFDARLEQERQERNRARAEDIEAEKRLRPRIIQIQPWRDLLLGLTDDGQIFRLTWVEGYRFDHTHFMCDSIPVFPGLPLEARRR